MTAIKVRAACAADCTAGVDALGEAFADDPLMNFLFHDDPRGKSQAVRKFLSILLRARIALEMPAQILQRNGDILGAMMGYDTTRPAWPQRFAEEWDQFESAAPPFAERLAIYDVIARAYQPSEPHYYLGVIGVHPTLQGQGSGKLLLETFCELSKKDQASRGVYLETASAASLAFYLRNDITLRGEGSLDGAPLWCVYRPH